MGGVTTETAGAGDADLARLEPWQGPWADDDPDANCTRDVALWASPGSSALVDVYPVPGE
jgi:hypothetical protein